MSTAIDNSIHPAALSIEAGRVHCVGDWTRLGIEALEPDPESLARDSQKKLVLDGGGITRLDTAGAWLLQRTRHALEALGCTVEVEQFTDNHMALLKMVSDAGVRDAPVSVSSPGLVVTFGKDIIESGPDLVRFLAFVGEACVALFLALLRPWRIRWREVIGDIQSSGVNALGIVGLLSFLIGVVIAYQGAVQLRLYGANIYVVDLLGLSLVRELAPMMAAIIVAGRTGSSYTAQIGTMVVTEEVSALQTMGIRPMDMLVLPKLISLIISLPLLSVFADILGLMGGMAMAQLQLGLSPAAFIARLGEAVSVRSFYIGIGKAPIFAAIIAIVGCYQGFQVSGSAESVGRRTTVSVVQAIFLVIVADAMFSIAFSWLGI